MSTTTTTMTSCATVSGTKPSATQASKRGVTFSLTPKRTKYTPIILTDTEAATKSGNDRSSAHSFTGSVGTESKDEEDDFKYTTLAQNASEEDGETRPARKLRIAAGYAELRRRGTWDGSEDTTDPGKSTADTDPSKLERRNTSDGTGRNSKPRMFTLGDSDSEDD